jgi:methyl-accepting chemotaxis protein
VSQGAREESEGLGQLGQAVHDLDHLTQQNAALVEQTAAAAAALRDQAGGLASEVARFRLA